MKPRDVTDTREALWSAVSQLMLQQWGDENLRRLAREAEVSPSTASRIKDRSTSIGLDVLERVAQVFGVEPWQLIASTSETGSPPLMRLSAEALDLAESLDGIADPRRRSQAYALAMHALRAIDTRGDAALAPAPSAAPSAGSAPAPQPRKRPRVHR